MSIVWLSCTRRCSCGLTTGDLVGRDPFRVRDKGVFRGLLAWEAQGAECVVAKLTSPRLDSVANYASACKQNKKRMNCSNWHLSIVKLQPIIGSVYVGNAKKIESSVKLLWIEPIGGSNTFFASSTKATPPINETAVLQFGALFRRKWKPCTSSSSVLSEFKLLEISSHLLSAIGWTLNNVLRSVSVSDGSADCEVHDPGWYCPGDGIGNVSIGERGEFPAVEEA